MKDKLRFLDKTTIAVLLLISLIGVLLIFSASAGTGTGYHIKQLVRIVFSTFCLFLVFMIDTRKIFEYAFPVYIVLILILVLQAILGRVVSGTRSWIKVGFLSIQVSEFIKVFLALCLARYLARIKIIGWKSLGVILLYVGIPFILIAQQPDMGTAFMLTSLVVVAIMLKGIRPLVVMVSLLLMVAVAFGGFHYVLKPYQKDRLISFVNPYKYEKSSGYQVIQSRIAIGSGGVSGKGLLKGSQTRYRFLPTRHTDFILSVMGEEFGFMGVAALFFLFFIFFFRQLDVNVPVKDEFYFIHLFTGIIFFQFTVNVLMTIGFFPVLGVPLPFVSYGGSSILAYFIGEGMVFRIRINRFLP